MYCVSYSVYSVFSVASIFSNLFRMQKTPRYFFMYSIVLILYHEVSKVFLFGKKKTFYVAHVSQFACVL